jgi:hypothetical protein
MPTWLLLQRELRFNDKLKPIFPENYRPDLMPDGSDVYYGVHFVLAPAKIEPGDWLTVELIVRAFPIDLCEVLQRGQKVFIKEGLSLVRAEGVITRRREYESPATTLLALQKEMIIERGQ